MNRTDLVSLVSTKTNLSPVKADAALEAIIKEILAALKDKQSVSITRLGSFSCVKRKERMGKNPKTGEEVLFKERTAVKFRPAKAFKDAMLKSDEV